MDDKEIKKQITEIKKALIDNTGKSRQAIEYQAKSLKKHGPFSDLVSYGILAQQNRIDVSKYISDEQILSIIRDGRDKIDDKKLGNQKQKIKKEIIYKIIKIGTDYDLKDPILSIKKINEAKKMAEHYAKLYVYENSIREVIINVLKNVYGADWWDSESKHHKLKDKYIKRKDKEGKNAWHSIRSAHPLYYLDFVDLVSIITSYWQDFKDIFPDIQWVKVRIEEIGFSRNIIAHNNPLKNNDIKRFEVYSLDWYKQIKSIKHLL